MKNNIYSKLIILLALVLCLTACEGAVHLPENTTPVNITPEPAADPEPVVTPPEPIVTVKVTFDANGGTGTMTDQTIEQNKATALTEIAFSRNGYSFIGWNTTADFTDTPPYTDLQNVTLSEDLTLYAMWDGKVYQVKYEFSHNLDSTADVLFPFTNDNYKDDIVFRYCGTTDNATGIYGSDYSYEKYTKFSEHFSLESYSPVTYYVPPVTTYKSGVGVETNTLPDSYYIEKDYIYSHTTTFSYNFVDWYYKDANDNIKPLNKMSGYSIIPDEDYDAIIANSEYVILYATFSKATTGK